MTRYYPSDPEKWSSLQERNGLNFNPNPPAVYFICEESRDTLIEDLPNSNTALVRYSTKDVAKFAEITRAADGCCSHFFVVYEDGVEQSFDVNNPENSYTFSRSPKFKFLSAVRRDASAIKQFKEKGRMFEERLSNREFRLKDGGRIEVRDGKVFSLVVLCEEEDECFYEKELMIVPEYNHALFICETIDDVLYLKNSRLDRMLRIRIVKA
ncbi:hypothetical protein DL89DRAFT_256835 [Linderina pennispora]|uniref:Uncharacterized protein n=1 Tax=Linderina pennispora TaxID=61395 RepID=A0A1Y1WBD7_9FUNG|nr:uncharacterized protein DL89DRAFT_256835 [Linderina pennispora]ORX70638.1 hypothetical protein DL89DRAFT_256835 [Linderina pennispora]